MLTGILVTVICWLLIIITTVTTGIVIAEKFNERNSRGE